MDFLASNGLILDGAYAQHVCSPSRAALLTGFYPFRVGNPFFYVNEAYGLTVEVPMLQEALKELGYLTHIVGKWHLGHCNEVNNIMNA